MTNNTLETKKYEYDNNNRNNYMYFGISIY